MNTITIEIDSKWHRRLHSPIYKAMSALRGVSVTFAPLFLYWCGQEENIFGAYKYVIVGISFAMIFVVPWYFERLGDVVSKELYKIKTN
jgi:hypothetical protein